MDYSESMTVDQLCTYFIEQLGMNEDDARKIKEEGYGGKSILVLNKDSRREDVHSLMDKMTKAGRGLLRDFLNERAEERVGDHYDGSKQGVARSSSVREDESMLFTSFKLGYGVDATDPSPLRNSNEKVRIVLSNLTNVQEATKDERKSYQEKISSLASHTSSVNFSVSDLVGKVLTLSAEAEYSREKSREMIAEGDKATTRTIYFKPYQSKEYYKKDKSEETTDCDFEKELCEFLEQHTSSVGAEVGDNAMERVELFLRAYPSEVYDVLKSALKFLKVKRITHYISAIDLGAVVYSTSVMKSAKNTKGAGLEAGVDFIAGLGAKSKKTQEASQSMSKRHKIGDIDIVRRGRGEGVIGYQILPVFTLINNEHREIKKVLQNAIQYYLQEERGPFIISCGPNFEIFWKVNRLLNSKEVLIGTRSEKEASLFYVDKSICPGEINIAYYGEDGDTRKHSRYLSTNSKLTGKDDGPLQVGGGRAANFILKHPAKGKSILSVSDWESDPCFVKAAPRRVQKKSYLGFNEKHNKVVCVSQRDEEKKINFWLRLKLKRVDIQQLRPRIDAVLDGSRSTIVTDEVEEDGGDLDEFYEDYDPEFEFDQVSDSDSI